MLMMYPDRLRSCAALAILYFLFFSPIARADQDTNLRLEQSTVLQAREKEQRLLEAEQAREDAEALVIDGQVYQVEDNLNALGQAVYLSVKARRWVAARGFLARYLALPGHDMMLVYYAQGALARAAGALDTAETSYRALLELQPDFLPGQLELARVLFENHKNHDALKLFEQIRASLPIHDPKAQGVLETVDAFSQALLYRDSWQGAFSFGPGYNTNLNLSSESYTCLLLMPNGDCLVERKTPKAQSAYGTTFEASLNKRISLGGHHGISFQGLAYGDNYLHHSQYNEHTLLTYLGYSYHTADYQWLAAPLFEYRTQGNDALYQAWGGKLSGLYLFSAATAFKLEAEAKDLRFLPDGLDFQSGWQYAGYATLWHQLPGQWLLFGGLDWTDKRTDEAVYAYQMAGVRLGVQRAWEIGIETSLFTSFRRRDYQAYSPLLAARRQDDEQSYTLETRLTGLSVWDLTPVVSLTHNRVHSNVDWLYSHEQSEVSLKIEKRF
ncbi:surface lipoprotein assembly modifier [Photobacterium sp. Hal280]|uniref:surface lipoprotein assembly modifier n=1 Tax=Photobacterium sp. Hal280 TaxID=3035163 RepID=UPI00301CC74A